MNSFYSDEKTSNNEGQRIYLPVRRWWNNKVQTKNKSFKRVQYRSKNKGFWNAF